MLQRKRSDHIIKKNMRSSLLKSLKLEFQCAQYLLEHFNCIWSEYNTITHKIC